ncbi:DUF1579 domain-containing protein [Herpetosiphon giganteus]|uniref:DUF1579 domain-containing protein n=1 Tax=Herpetosiphon giganteus TaxID=2029754 RepID=UPI00195A0286|nr:DUF1579 domain-containing protein [Herpetosiphon giganteus]MBM7845679.1 hypothetical protein [Herpetosiphon giganteus]
MTDQRTQAIEQILQSVVGQWQGIARTWFGPETLADESPIRGSLRRIGTSRFVIHEYESAFEATPLHGAAIYGYNQLTASFEGAWVDSFHMPTNIMLSTGNPADSTLNVLGSYAVEGNSDWGWRTEIVADGPDRLLITAYNRQPDEPEAKAVEIIYTRVNETA